jgi:hypothetical protein
MVIKVNDDVFTSTKEGARMLAEQASRARTSVQVASLDGTTQPCLLLVNRGETLRISGAELDALILACQLDAEFAVGQQS